MQADFDWWKLWSPQHNHFSSQPWLLQARTLGLISLQLNFYSIRTKIKCILPLKGLYNPKIWYLILNSALLWHRLMGKGVLAVDSTASPFLRSYAHCSKGKVSALSILFLFFFFKWRAIVCQGRRFSLHKQGYEKILVWDSVSIFANLKEK